MNRITSIAVLLLAVAFATSAYAEPNNTGQSGAPGLQSCASSCHGTGTGTVSLTGFPAQYTPNTTYLIALNHAGGSSIKNFNASCRVGMGTTNAGTITSGYRTITYNVTDETNGIHLSQDDRDSCNFSWTSPGVGTGEVRLYVAAHQGGMDSGPNTDIVLVASEGAATPPQCTDPNPPDLATDVPVNVVLSWTGSADVWWYNVFFGATNPPPYIDFQPETEFTPLNVQPNTTYYWKINPANGNGDTEGEIWSFTTEGAGLPQCTNPVPADSSSGIPLDFILEWIGSEGAEIYHVYFGATNPPPYVTSNTEAEFIPVNLQYNTTYFWKVNPANQTQETEGEIWQYTTLDDSPPPQVTNPSPEHLAVDVPIDNVLLSWDHAVGAGWYTINFGTQINPPLVGTTEGTSFGLAPLEHETDYYWRVNSVNEFGETAGTMWTFTTEPIDASGNTSAMPTTTALGRPYPNPFNAETTIPFVLSSAQHITLTIYDMTGREVVKLADGEYPAGKYNVKWNSNATASGVYLVRMTAGNEVYVAKMLALK